jgi:ABC-type polysaccharide/polyol phosphate transport system ATPase subunit
MEVIRLDGVSLWRRTQEEFSYDLKKTLLAMLEGRYRKPAKRLVLDHLDILVNAGEKVGIIGANGSGKSTLLKVICKILEPTRGQVRVHGNIAPLIELGAGFDADISVVDNILLYGVMLGFSEKEMRKRTNDILEFAELQDYAKSPVKALSSGMVARLGFAIATDVQPDILILDEVLSVGDESFKNKCKQRIEGFWKDQTTILLVSHDLDFLQKSCERVIWLERGKIKQIGDAPEVVEAYLESVRAVVSTNNKEALQKHLADETQNLEMAGEVFLPRSGIRGHVAVTRLFLADENKQPISYVEFGKQFYIGIEYSIEAPVQKLQFGFYLTNPATQLLLEPVSHNWLPKTGAICDLGNHCIYAKIPAPLLVPGHYTITGVGAYEEGYGHHYLTLGKLMSIHVHPPAEEHEWIGGGLVQPPIEWNLE